MSGASVFEQCSNNAEHGPGRQLLPGGGSRDRADRDRRAVGAFLPFFARHMQRHPEQLRTLTPEFARGISALAGGELDSPRDDR